jgi:hypothetical protein
VTGTLIGPVQEHFLLQAHRAGADRAEKPGLTPESD